MPKPTYESLLCPGSEISEEQLVTDRNLLAFERSILTLNRRSLLKGLALTSAAGATGVGFGGRDAMAQASAGPAVAQAIIDVLNFALNLEYLEANFYLLVSTGSGLSTTDTGSGAGMITGAPSKLALDKQTMAVAQALAQDERNHVELLRNTIMTLAGTPISQPAINFSAMGAITTQAQFLATARQFTALGGSAYCGSAMLLVSNQAVLTTASQILGAEGQHGGALNFLCAEQGVVSPPIDAQDVPPSATTFFTVDATNALSPARNASQVLGVAYGVSMSSTTIPPPGITMGGFFPNGVNGNIKST